MKSNSQQGGFTLVEVLVAMMVLTIGILSVFVMQISAIRGNSFANHLSGASTRALDQIEQILSWDADAVTANLVDTNVVYPGAGADGVNITADGTAAALLKYTNSDGTNVSDIYNVYWDGTPVMDPVNVGLLVGYRVEVRVVWNEAGRQRDMVMYVVKSI